jgi:uncharacterized protein
MSTPLKISIVIGVIVAVVLGIYAVMQSTNNNDYNIRLESKRTTTDVWFSNDLSSPFVKTNTPFHRLNYFPPNLDFIIIAKYEKNKKSDSVHLITNMGEAQTYQIYAKATFKRDGKKNTLDLLYAPEEGQLFIPFIDATSGNSTYGAGRYLDAAIPTGDEIILDFNTAYNPYCAYVEGFSCPFPPKSNILKVAIEAGEKSYHE